MHTCFPSVLAKVFRIASSARPRPHSVAEFLNPPLRRHSKQFNTSQSRKAWPHPLARERHTNPATSWATDQPTRIPRPPEDRARDPVEWIRCLDEHIAPSPTAAEHEVPIPAIDLARYVVDAQNLAGVNILSSLGLDFAQWEKLLFLVNRILREVPAEESLEVQEFNPLENIRWPIYDLDKATGYGGLNAYVRKEGRKGRSLDEFTDSLPLEASTNGMRTQFLGVLWRTLGDMMISAARPQSDTRIMVVARQMIAALHHLNVIPQSLYHDPPPNSFGFPQRPSLLNEFEKYILPSLADAAWNSHDSPVHAAAKENSAQYIMGYEIPRTRFKSDPPFLGPEIWMELILWSCLHGGWTMEGIDTILKATSEPESCWSILSWNKLVDELETEITSTNPQRPHLKQRIERKITSEVMASLIDRAIDDMQAAPAARGFPASEVIGRICRLKEALQREQIGMRWFSWDTFLLRCVEPDGILLQNDSKLALDVAGLSLAFAGVHPRDTMLIEEPEQDPQAYALEPSAASLGIYHDLLRGSALSGNPSSAVRVLARLLDHVDLNKRLLIDRFFQSLKQIDAVQYRTTDLPDFTSKTPPSAPITAGLDVLLPDSAISSLLDLATDTNDYHFGQWLLFSEEVTGPLIIPTRYTNWRIASSAIRFAGLTGDTQLIREVLVPQRKIADRKKRRIKEEVRSSFLCIQISAHQWDSAENTLETFASDGSAPKSDVLAVIAKQLLLQYTERGVSMEIFMRTSELAGIFGRLKAGVYGRLGRATSLDLNTILAILVTADTEWTAFARGKWTRAGQQPLRMATDQFNTVLDGIAQAYGPLVAAQVINHWCGPRFREQPLHGNLRLPERPMEELSGMSSQSGETPSPRLRVHLEQYQIPIVQFISRFVPNVGTARVMMKSVVRANRQLPFDLQGSGLADELRPIFAWAVAMYRKQGFSASDLMRELRLMEAAFNER